jgi:hypothetical protein
MKERNLYRERMWGGGASDSDGILRALLTRTERRNWKEGGGGREGEEGGKGPSGGMRMD